MSKPSLSSPTSLSNEALLNNLDTFARRHIGPSQPDVAAMLEAIGVSSLDQLIDEAVPETIRLREEDGFTGR